MSNTFKTDWDYNDVIEAEDMNRIETNSKDHDTRIEKLELKEIVVLEKEVTPPGSAPITFGWNFDYPEGFTQENTVVLSAGFQRNHTRAFVDYGYIENPDTAIGEYRTRVQLSEEHIEWTIRHTGYTNKYYIRLTIARFK